MNNFDNIWKFMFFINTDKVNEYSSITSKYKKLVGDDTQAFQQWADRCSGELYTISNCRIILINN